MTLDDFKKKGKDMPDEPGVYFFLGPRKEVLYIGKATSLRDRVRSYFSSDLADARSPFIVQMVEKARGIDWRQTDSVLEALILEASLIKTHKPHYNTLEKDDKSFNHVVITDEAFPRVLVVRGKDLAHGQHMATGGSGASLRTTHYNLRTSFGPFPHGTDLKVALKLVRKIFPFRDTCEPCETDKSQKSKVKRVCRPCFNRQLGLCPGVCTGEVTQKEYARTIRHLKLFFAGKKQALVRELERDMAAAARVHAFEKAQETKRQLFALRHIQDVALIKDEFRTLRSSESGPHQAVAYRIEAYDAAHLRGEAALGVMTVVEDGVADKKEYRTFTLRETKAGDDTGALTEILTRRLGHPEWQLPKLIVVDGGTAQRRAAQRVLSAAGVAIPVVSVVKDEKHRARGIEGERSLIRPREQDILLANAEAHRFAIGRHRHALRLK